MSPARGSGESHWDAIVIGTGFGGSTVALQLARAGKSVLVLERGRWVDRDESAWDIQAIHVNQKYRGHAPYAADTRRGLKLDYPNAVVGGASVFYGAASFRFREDDFRRASLSGGGPGDAVADWPIGYDSFAPYYAIAERELGVVGLAGADPTEPPRCGPYPEAPAPYAIPSARIVAAGEALGLHPFPIPLAINFSGNGGGRGKCIRCLTCDLFPCKLGAKNDLAVTVLPHAVAHGAVVRDQTVATRLIRQGQRIVAVECADLRTREVTTFSCDVAVLSAGAIASPALILASGLGALHPNDALIGRYLMRHCNGIVIGFFPFRTNPEGEFHKQVAFTDFYHQSGGNGNGRLEPCGMIQSLQVPPPEYIRTMTFFPANLVGPHSYAVNQFLMCIAEDEAQPDNRVTLSPTLRDDLGQPVAAVRYRHHPADLRRRDMLQRQAGRILRQAGARFRGRYAVDTFSHALGTCRFGTDPRTAVLDPACRFFGSPNLFVADASFMPTAAAVNPSLTIAANGLRVGDHIVAEWDHIARAERE